MGKANAAKTHCPAGHPYDEANTARDAKGWRRCRACNNERVKAAYAANPEPVRERRREEVKRRGAEINQRRRERDVSRKDEIREQDRARYAESPKKRLAYFMYRHRMRPDEWSAMWATQRGACYLCGDPLEGSAITVEHDHACCGPHRSCRICRRGLAHQRCNTAIGNAGDDPVRLRRMADALEAAQRMVSQRMAARPIQDVLPIAEEEG